MAIENNYVALAYKLYVKDEDDEQESLTEQCSAAHPFVFITHLGATIPAFEAAVGQLRPGENFDFVIPCKDAYGEFQEELMIDVEKKVFERDGKFDDDNIYEGNIVPLQGEDGSRFHGTVIEVKPDAVTIDLNHPRAGQDLHFVGMVVENRPATPAEITEQMHYFDDACDCGGQCGQCGGGCGGCK